MSSKRARSMSVLFEHGFIIGRLFAIPLIVSFIEYIAAASFGTGTLPAVGYGIQCVSVSSGVCTFWSVTTGVAPTMPTGLLNMLNEFLIFISLVLGIVAAIKLGPSLFESVSSSE